jgi:hypothetical protein
MRHVLLTLCVLSLTLLPSHTRGNSPPVPAAIRYLQTPDKAKSAAKAEKPAKEVSIIRNAPVTMTYQLDVPRPRLIIPQKYAVIDGKKAEAEPAGPRNLFAGLALSAAFVTGGIWLVRRGGNAGKAVLVAAILVGILGMAIFMSDVFGNEAPPPRIQPTPLEINGNTANLGMDVVIVAEGDRIQLILPKRMLPAIMIPREVYSNPPFDPLGDLIKKSLEPAKNDKKD